jgi:hypothetical protein
MRTLLLLLPTLALAAPVAEVDPQVAAKTFVEKRKAEAGELKPLKTDDLTAAYPGLTFFTVRFRQWPVATAPAEGFRASNVLVIDEKGEPLLLTNQQELFKLSKRVKAPDKKAAVQVVRALMKIQEELFQDGFYKFEVSEDLLRTDTFQGKLAVFGTSRVVEGGNGSVGAALTFDAEGNLIATSFSDSVKPGVRPRCQATLLLHPDPGVRAVCERNLLLLGAAAREYLQEQRARANPELQAEIDRVWRTIEAQGR